MGDGDLIALVFVIGFVVSVGAAVVMHAQRRGVGWPMFRPRGILGLMRRDVVVHTDVDSIRGILVAEYRDLIVLEHARYVGAENDSAIAGEVHISKAAVRFIQAGRES